MSDTPRTDKEIVGELLVFASFARKLERELAAVTEQRDKALRERESTEKEVDLMLERAIRAEEQRDRLAEEIENLKASGIHTCHDQCKRPMCAMRRQRDRMAAVIKAATVLIAAKGRHNTMLAYQGLRDALAAVEGDKP
jgi:septal ring factor EnvC (AmiA/AmiB activator)